ncbi:MAG: hypothetical protein ACMUJM_05245 [bacterium]
MSRERKIICIVFVCLVFAVVVSGGLFSSRDTQAQYWAALPPYNVLWPLYSPVLSPLVGPVDPLTGLAAPVPLVSELTASTILPVQPAIAWDPCQPAPWALFNTPPTISTGLLFFDQAYGLNTWPPPYLQDPITGAPNPITYLLSLTLIAPVDIGHLEYLIPLANITYAQTFGLNGAAVLDLLSAADIWGLPPITPY